MQGSDRPTVCCLAACCHSASGKAALPGGKSDPAGRRIEGWRDAQSNEWNDEK